MQRTERRTHYACTVCRWSSGYTQLDKNDLSEGLAYLTNVARVVSEWAADNDLSLLVKPKPSFLVRAIVLICYRDWLFLALT